MVIQTPIRTTLADFQAYVALPENSEARLELLAGEIIDVPSNPFVSVIAILIATALQQWITARRQGGYITGESGGFIIDGQVFAPDVAYLRALPTASGFEATPPVLAVEVLSDPRSNTEQATLRRKLAHYQRAGVIVWVVDYLAREVEVHEPGAAVQVVGAAGVLLGGAALPGLELAVSAIFPQDQPNA